jgi:uncharacterized repeat protein (TIGR01451 family)
MRTRVSIAMAALALIALAGTASAGTADLKVVVFDAPDPVRVGSNLTFSIAVTNLGPLGATNVVVTDVMPGGMTFVTNYVSQGTWTQEGDTVTCNLGNLANGATAAVRVVVLATLPGRATNQASVYSAEVDPGSANDRASSTTEVREVNRSPEITLPGPHSLPVGATTTFPVTVWDPNHDPSVILTNTVKPSGATYIDTNFTWQAPGWAAGTTNTVTFVANDQQGETNSVVTNSTTIVVPFDSDFDSLGDGWEYTNFFTLTNEPAGDRDNDGSDNWTEYVAGTQPTNLSSKFYVISVTNAIGVGQSNHVVKVSTQPGRKYWVYFTDQRLSNAVPWVPFANTNWGVWRETNTVPTNYVFSDNESTNTTAGTPGTGGRFYRVKVRYPP